MTLSKQVVCGVQVRAREETLVKDEARHQQLKEESKKQVIAFAILLHALLVCMLPTDYPRTRR